MTVAQRAAAAATVGTRPLIDAPPIVEELREVKDPDEIGRIRAACRLAMELFGRLKAVLRPGISEQEVAGDLESTAGKRGEEQRGFPPTMAPGRSWALPTA